MKNENSHYGTKKPNTYSIVERRFADGSIKYFIEVQPHLETMFDCMYVETYILDYTYDDIDKALAKILDLQENDKSTTVIEDVKYDVVDGKVVIKKYTNQIFTSTTTTDAKLED